MTTSNTPQSRPVDLQLPRARWPEHPNYPRQVLLVRSHDGFRRASAHLVQRATPDGDTGRGAPSDAIAWTFRYLKSAMRGHEGYEEHKLYPYLEARWGLRCDALRQGHEQLAEAGARVLDAAGRGAEPASGALLQALVAHDAVLRTHLDDEEALVVPALLALSPPEFDRYYRGDITTLLRGLAEGSG